MADPDSEQIRDTLPAPAPASKFILTVIVRDQVEEVEETLRAAADALDARLTRGDFEPADDPGFYRKVRARTLRKQGVLR